LSLYEQIGEDRLKAIVERTYIAAFEDPMIGYLFLGKSRERIVEMQLKFLKARFGGPKEYLSSGGKDLATAHRGLGLRKGHLPAPCTA
jgi:truncated hemoglobin YjbI